MKYCRIFVHRAQDDFLMFESIIIPLERWNQYLIPVRFFKARFGFRFGDLPFLDRV